MNNAVQNNTTSMNVENTLSQLEGLEISSEYTITEQNNISVNEENTSNQDLLLNNKTSKFVLSKEEIELLESHPFTKAVPQINKVEFEGLKNDVQVNGFIESVIITKDLQIVDGRARVEIARDVENQHILYFEYYQGRDEEMLDYILSKNVFRRHLNQGQKAVGALQLHDILKAENKIKFSKKMSNIKNNILDAESSEEKIDSRAEVAKYYNVASSYIAKAKKVGEFNPELLQSVLTGDKSLEEVYQETSNPKPAKSENDIISEYESDNRKLNSIEKVSIDFLKKLGLVDITASKLVIDKLKVADKKFQSWEKKSVNSKFKMFKDAFLSHKKIEFNNDEASYSEFVDSLKEKQESKPDESKENLNDKVESFMLKLDNEDKEYFQSCIIQISKEKSEIDLNDRFIEIVKGYIFEVSGLLND